MINVCKIRQTIHHRSIACHIFNIQPHNNFKLSLKNLLCSMKMNQPNVNTFLVGELFTLMQIIDYLAHDVYNFSFLELCPFYSKKGGNLIFIYFNCVIFDWCYRLNNLSQVTSADSELVLNVITIKSLLQQCDDCFKTSPGS